MKFRTGTIVPVRCFVLLMDSTMQTELRSRTRKDGKVVRETFYETTCVCGRKRWLRKKDMQVKSCFHCAQKARAKAGFQAMQQSLRSRYGDEIGRKLSSLVVRDYLAKNPPTSERQFATLLVGGDYQANVLIEDADRFWIVDFLLPGGIVFEINGGCHVNTQPRDSAKIVDLLRHGYTVIVIETEELTPNWILKGYCS